MRDPTERYLTERSMLGYIDRDLARDLRNFAAFAAERHAMFLKLDDALDWVANRPGRKRRSELLGALRRLGIYLNAEDRRHEIVPETYVKISKGPKLVPFLYTAEETSRVLAGFSEISLPHPFDAITYRHIIALVAATGMRISEAVRLKVFDFDGDALFVRKAKGDRDRLVYLHPTTATALRAYLDARPPSFRCNDLFSVHTGRAPLIETVRNKFRRCIDHVGLKGRRGSGPPRIHDFRHTFAVNCLAECDFGRENVSAHVVALTTYLGHVSIVSTFWYLDLTTEGKRDIAAALEGGLDV